MDRYRLERFLEFLVIGVILGVTEDLIAVKLATGAEFTLEMLLIVIGVTIPFAAFSELVVDSDEHAIIKKITSRMKRR